MIFQTTPLAWASRRARRSHSRCAAPSIVLALPRIWRRSPLRNRTSTVLPSPVGNEVRVPVRAEIEHEQLREAAEAKRAVDALLAVGPDRRELEERLPAGTTERRHRARVLGPAEQTDLVLLG